MTGLRIDVERAQQEMAVKTKPLGALGRLEDVGVRLAVLQGTLSPVIDRARVCVFGADHGVTDEGVSAYPRAVTGEMMRNFDRGGAAINVIARAGNVEVEVIDVGVDADLSSLATVHSARVRAGSRNFAREPAMTPDEVRQAMEVGASAARRAHDSGVQVIGLGEMGIGNTTSAAALLSVFASASAEQTVGRGTGIDDAVLEHKRRVVEQAVGRHTQLTSLSAVDALRALGGLEIAAMAGAALEASSLGLAVIADGFISTTAVLAALHLARDESPARVDRLSRALFFAHRSAERGHTLAMEACGGFENCDARPLLDLGLRLGEGTGAALAVSLLRAAAAVMRDMATFTSAGVSDGGHTEHRA
jgi:nicotinate-nucleotide--dimethylbenzimidazole phosphoribosyltransferase